MIEVNERLTERINRARLKLEVKRASRFALVTLIGVFIGVGCAYWAIKNISRTTLSDSRTVSFAVADATSVVEGRHEVRFKGVPAGDITKVEIVDQQPIITVKIQKKFGPVFRDAEVAVRPTTPLEDMYLDVLDRGSPRAGEASEDAPVPADRVTTSVDIADVLNAFQPEVRGRFRSLLANLGRGLDDRGAALQAVFAELVPTLREAGRLTRQLAERDVAVRRLVNNTGVLTAELGRREGQLRELVRNGSATFSTVQAGAADLEAMLAALPGTIRELDGSMRAVSGVVDDVDLAVARLTPVARELPGSLEAVRELSADARPAVEDLREPVRRLLPLSRSLRPLSRHLERALRTLAPTVPVINRTAKTLQDCEWGVSHFFLWDPAMGTLQDSRGAMPRADLQASAVSSGVMNDPRYFVPSCAGGETVGGRPVEEKDKR